MFIRRQIQKRAWPYAYSLGIFFFLKQIKNIPIFKNKSKCMENKLAHEKA